MRLEQAAAYAKHVMALVIAEMLLLAQIQMKNAQEQAVAAEHAMALAHASILEVIQMQEHA